MTELLGGAPLQCLVTHVADHVVATEQGHRAL